MSFRIITGNKAIVRFIAIFVLMLCMLLSGCVNKTAADENNGDSQAIVGSSSVEPTGSSETTSSIAHGEESETQNSTKSQNNTMLDDESTTESSEVPTYGTIAPALETEDTHMPGYGIELPDDNWDGE